MRKRWLRALVVSLLLLGSYAAIFGTLFAAAGSHMAVWVATAGWASTVVVGLLVRRAWPGEPLRAIVALLLVAVLFSLVALYAGWLLSYGVQINAELCGEGWSSAIALITGGLAYVAMGTVLGRRPRALVWAWPLAVVGGLALRLALLALLPGAHGYCET